MWLSYRESVTDGRTKGILQARASQFAAGVKKVTGTGRFYCTMYFVPVRFMLSFDCSLIVPHWNSKNTKLTFTLTQSPGKSIKPTISHSDQTYCYDTLHFLKNWENSLTRHPGLTHLISIPCDTCLLQLSQKCPQIYIHSQKFKNKISKYRNVKDDLKKKRNIMHIHTWVIWFANGVVLDSIIYLYRYIKRYCRDISCTTLRFSRPVSFPAPDNIYNVNTSLTLSAMTCPT